MNKLYWAKVKPDAKVPQKRYEDAGYDLYPCFEEDYMVIEPHETKLVPLGVASAFDPEFVMILKERGSTGTKGIAQRSGVIDSGYRGEILACFKNRTSAYSIQLFNKAVFAINSILSRLELKNLQIPFNAAGLEFPYHPGDKIGQIVILPYPTVEFEEVDELSPSERGEGGHGSTGKSINE